MLRNNKRIIVYFIWIFIVQFCSSTETKVYYNKSSYDRPIKEIALGFIEVRNLEVDPYVVKNIKDTLRFELERNAFKVSSDSDMMNSMHESKVEENVLLQESDIFRLTTTSGFDLFLQGYIQESVTGDVLKRKINSSIVLFLHGRNGGKRIGEIRLYTKDKTLKSNLNIQNMVTEIVQSLVRETRTTQKK